MNASFGLRGEVTPKRCEVSTHSHYPMATTTYLVGVVHEVTGSDGVVALVYLPVLVVSAVQPCTVASCTALTPSDLTLARDTVLGWMGDSLSFSGDYSVSYYHTRLPHFDGLTRLISALLCPFCSPIAESRC